MHSAPRQAFRLFPAGSRGETQQRDRIGMAVRAGLDLIPLICRTLPLGNYLLPVPCFPIDQDQNSLTDFPLLL